MKLNSSENETREKISQIEQKIGDRKPIFGGHFFPCSLPRSERFLRIGFSHRRFSVVIGFDMEKAATTRGGSGVAWR